MSEGCPICDWSGEVAITSDRSHEYYTHVVLMEGEMLRGRTCSMRTRERSPPPLDRLLPWRDHP